MKNIGHTVEEAICDLYCPFAKSHGYNMNPDDDELDPTGIEISKRCHSNTCAAWRWMPGDEDADEDEARGYCGLAGKP